MSDQKSNQISKQTLWTYILLQVMTIEDLAIVGLHSQQDCSSIFLVGLNFA